MQIDRCCGSVAGTRGMVLPVVLVLLAGLWLLCLSLLSIIAIDQRSSRSQMHGLQAEMALLAGLEEVRGQLQQACDDEFLVIQERSDNPRACPRLMMVSPRLEDGSRSFVHQPLFSCLERPSEGPSLAVSLMPQNTAGMARIFARPSHDPAEVQWLPLHDQRGRLVARYAYWVEDLEARIDPSLSLEGLRLEAMDSSRDHLRSREFLRNRSNLLSPESALSASGVRAPLQRSDGRLTDPWEDFLERCTIVGLQSYVEQARVPYVQGLSPAVMGQAKRDLNQLLELDPHQAVQDMAEWIRLGLPRFEGRQGGFPDHYLETLAANALDYADEDDRPRVLAGRYRGIDGQPLLSEVVLHLHYQGLEKEGDRWVLKWTLRLFAELWNMSSRAIEAGQARLSYEVNLRPTVVGFGGPGLPFDDPSLLDDSNQSTHALERRGSHYLTPVVQISLQPNEYRFHEFARVDYAIECSPQLDESGQPLSEWFDLVEMEHEARGLSLIWNGQEVERLTRIHRDPHGLANFRTDRRRKTAKACIPGLNYGGYGSMINNPGDPRMSHYLRAMPNGENAYPENISPHRRNIRRRNIYDRDPSPEKTRHYGRVMPSQWPDGGHDSPTGNFRVTTSDARFPTDQEFWPMSGVPTPQASHAPQRLSNEGRFRSATELGRVHDPLMWSPSYPDLRGVRNSGRQDTAELLGLISFWQRPAMPMRRGRWPEVSWTSIPSAVHGGGNSLRIGRQEHERFDLAGMRASQLLDLFHAGPQNIEGRINLNTASREVLRCLVYGELVKDEAISKVVDFVHDTTHAFGPVLEPWQASEERMGRLADEVADAIIRARPFVSPSELSWIQGEDGQPLFGNPSLPAPLEHLQWSDEAAEELFARLHQRSGVRSRNFRVWLLGQTLGPDGQVQARASRVVTLFVDPGERGSQGEMIPNHQKVRQLHARAF